MLGEGGIMPKYNCMDLKKYGGVWGGYAKIFFGFEKMLGGGYAKIFYGGLKLFGGLKNVWGYANKFCVWI